MAEGSGSVGPGRRSGKGTTRRSSSRNGRSSLEGGEITMDVEREDGEPVGSAVDDRLVVGKVTSGSRADGYLLPGDQITTVIGIAVRNKDDFFHRLKFAHPRLRMTFRRTPVETSDLGQELEKLIRRRAGFEYLVAELDWPAQQERQLGIVLANRTHRVIVGSLKAGSLGEEKLKVLDRIGAVNGTPVSD